MHGKVDVVTISKVSLVRANQGSHVFKVLPLEFAWCSSIIGSTSNASFLKALSVAASIGR